MRSKFLMIVHQILYNNHNVITRLIEIAEVIYFKTSKYRNKHNVTTNKNI